MSSWETFADWANDVADDPGRRKRVALAVIVAGIAVLGLFHERIYNTVSGPFALETSELARLESIPSRRLVRLEQHGKPLGYSQLIATGASERTYHLHGASETTADFRVLEVDGREVLVRVEQTGTDAVEGLISDLDPRYASLVSRHGPPLMLDCTKQRYQSWGLALAALGLLAIGVGLDQLRRAGRRREPPRSRLGL